MDAVTWLANALLATSAWQATILLDYHPACWAVWSVCVWCAYVNIRGWAALSVWDRRQLCWGVVGAAGLLAFLRVDKDFEVGFGI